MFRNNHRPSGLNVAPVNSRSRKSPEMPLRSPFNRHALRTRRTIWPSRVTPCTQGLPFRLSSHKYQSAARTHRDVVGHVEHMRAWRFEQQTDRLFTDVELPDLARARVAPIGGGDIDAPAAIARALQPPEDRAAAVRGLSSLSARWKRPPSSSGASADRDRDFRELYAVCGSSACDSCWLAAFPPPSSSPRRSWAGCNRCCGRRCRRVSTCCCLAAS